VQNESSVALLDSIGIKNSTISGDTRFDRVFQIVKQERSFPEIEQFINNKPVFVAGSTWPADENRLQAMINSDTGIKFIIAPHEINRDHIKNFISGCHKKVILYSSMTADEIPGADVLIIDTIGILSHLYRYATISYIGGGFGKGIHNILEAVTFGIPVLFGPNYHKFQEARDLIEQKGAYEVNNEEEIIKITLKLLHDQSLYAKCVDTCKQYIGSKIGATQMILDQVFKEENINNLKTNTI
jgi:3-deoxy-D-manno-octulosonic-acid transferase